MAEERFGHNQRNEVKRLSYYSLNIYSSLSIVGVCQNKSPK